MTWIAEMAVVFVDEHGKRTPGRIAIGMPQPGDRDWRCAAALDGWFTSVGPILGGSPMQALVLALRFLGAMLHEWLAGGGRVLTEDGTDARVDVVFGPLLRPAAG